MEVDRLGGGGSDYAAFVQHVGVPAADLFFGGGNVDKIFAMMTQYLTWKC